MSETKMIYDIRTSENAEKTLVNLTDVPLSIWAQYADHSRECNNIGKLIENVIIRHGKLPQTYRTFDFIYFHITTSGNRCASFLKNGILDLPHSYLCPDSELRTFLESHNIYINLNRKTLDYRGKTYNIHYDPGACPRRGTEEYNCWSVGRKFFYDFTTCGFLSVWDMSAYGGKVHKRPEILKDIDSLLRTKLSQEWMETHSAYEVVARVSGENIVCSGCDERSEREKVLSYLTTAYNTAVGGPSENIVLIKNGVYIPPKDILQITPLGYWN